MKLRPVPLPQRSLWRLLFPGARSARAVALAALATASLLLARPWLESLWQYVMLGWMQALGLAGDFEARGSRGGWLGIATPLVEVPLPEAGATAYVLHGGAAALAWWGAGRLSEAWRPVAYALRLGAGLQAVSLLFFVGCPQCLPRTTQAQADALLLQVWALMLVLPWLHALGRALLPASRLRRLGLAGWTLGWLALLAPCLAATHVALLSLLGPLATPLLALLGGAVPVVLGLTAMHAWVLSWPDEAAAPRPVPPGRS